MPFFLFCYLGGGPGIRCRIKIGHQPGSMLKGLCFLGGYHSEGVYQKMFVFCGLGDALYTRRNAFYAVFFHRDVMFRNSADKPRGFDF